jgi:hypothetical protein
LEVHTSYQLSTFSKKIILSVFTTHTQSLRYLIHKHHPKQLMVFCLSVKLVLFPR